MKKSFTILALAALAIGGAAIASPSQAAVAISPASIAEATQAAETFHLTGGKSFKKFRYGYGRKYHRGGYYGKFHNGGYYGRFHKGFCYKYPYHWKCKAFKFKKGYKHY